MRVQHLNHASATFNALKLIDAAQKGVAITTEGDRVLESVRRYLYKTAPADLWVSSEVIR